MTLKRVFLRIRQSGHSSVRGRVAAACLGLGLATWVGSAVLARWAPDAGPSVRAQSGAAQHVLDDLAYRVGELQGRVLALEALRGRLAAAAGLAYWAPELVAPAPGSTAAIRTPAAVGTATAASAEAAQQLGRTVDSLRRHIERQGDSLALIDVALARHAGRQAGLPTRAPLADLRLSSPFGWRRGPLTGRMAMHEGLDFAAPGGSDVRAASGGLVVQAGRVQGYGRMVELDHGNGLRTRYAHASRLAVRRGDFVRQGDLIAYTGSSGRSTGPHLHFEVRMADYPLDPGLFMPYEPQPDVRPDAGRHLPRPGG